MRRMNSMLLGHHGASGRTDCMYLRIASCVAGSSQERGRWTVRVDNVTSSRSGMASSHASKTGDQLLSWKVCGVVMDLQRTDAGRDVDDASKVLLAQHAFKLMHTEPQVEIEDIGPDFDEQIPIARCAIHHVSVRMEYRC